MPFISVNDEPFHYRFDGPENAPVLMLSNSLGTDFSMWDPQIAQWSKHYRLLRYDSRGHGSSPAPVGPYAIEKLARDAIGIMDGLGIEKVNWCGLSKGGMVGMWLLSHARSRLNKAVLANTAALMGPPANWNNRIRAVNESGMAPVAAVMADRWFTKRFQSENPDEVARVIGLIAKQPPQGYNACCAAIRDMDQREAIRSVTTPVLVIVGSQDPATPPACGHLIHENIAGSQLVTLDAAHLSNCERPAEFTKAVLEFLK